MELSFFNGYECYTIVVFLLAKPIRAGHAPVPQQTASSGIRGGGAVVKPAKTEA